MPKRLSDSDLWNRDWFLNLEGKYQLFCFYLRDHCDHAGVWHPSFKRFEQSTGYRINSSDYLSIINNDRVRVQVLDNGKWWITGFIEDQYKTGMILNESFNPIRGVLNSLRANNVDYISMGYKLRDSIPSGRSKDQDKDQDNNSFNSLNPKEGMQGENQPETEKPLTWRTTPNIYLESEQAGYEAAIADMAWLEQQEKIKPFQNLNLLKTIERAHLNYWSTLAGWKQKKKSRSVDLDWPATFANAIGMKSNQVFDDKNKLKNNEERFRL